MRVWHNILVVAAVRWCKIIEHIGCRGKQHRMAALPQVLCNGGFTHTVTAQQDDIAGRG